MIQHNMIKRALLLLLASLVLACQPPKKQGELPTIDALIPQPQSVTKSNGKFELTEKTKIVIETDSEELNSIANYLADKLRTSTGFPLEVLVLTPAPSDGN